MIPIFHARLLFRILQTLLRRKFVVKILKHTAIRGFLYELPKRYLFGKPSKSPTLGTASALKGFDVAPATLEQRELLLDFLRRTYLKDEPLLLCKGLAGYASPAFEDYVLGSLREGISLMAVGRSPTDIQGVCINTTVQHNEPPVSKELFLQRVGRHAREIVEFDEFCFRKSDIFRRYFVSHLFEISYIAVDAKVRRSGLAMSMAERSIQLAKELNYPMAIMHCTSQYSTKLAQSLGMTEAWSMPYNKYLNSKQKPIFRPSWPHTHVKMMVLNLQ